MSTCPNIVTGDEGTSYCALAESSVAALRKERDQLRAEVRKRQEQIGQQLAACDCAAMMDTPETHEKNKTVTRENPFWSNAFESVMRRTAECIALRAELAKERAQFPSDRAYPIVEVFSQEGDPVFVSGINGATNGDMVAQIEADLNERRDFMDKGDGRYLYRVVYESAQTDEEGRIELPGYWDLSLVAFAPLTEETK